MVKKETPGMSFLIFIDDEINERHLSLSKVSKETHIPLSSLSSYVKGEVIPPLQYLFVLADYLDVPISYLINYHHKYKFPRYPSL